MDALRDYLAMGGYAWFIWPAYVFTLGFMLWITVATVRNLRASRRLLAQLEQNAPHRQRRAQQRTATGTTGVQTP